MVQSAERVEDRWDAQDPGIPWIKRHGSKIGESKDNINAFAREVG
jgi:hypothetical protein